MVATSKGPDVKDIVTGQASLTSDNSKDMGEVKTIVADSLVADADAASGNEIGAAINACEALKTTIELADSEIPKEIKDYEIYKEVKDMSDHELDVKLDQLRKL